MKNINPTTLKSWEKISAHFDIIKDKNIVDFFKENKSRMKEMSYECLMNVRHRHASCFIKRRTCVIYAGS